VGSDRAICRNCCILVGSQGKEIKKSVSTVMWSPICCRSIMPTGCGPSKDVFSSAWD
jgi:hypothetical protein